MLICFLEIQFFGKHSTLLISDRWQLSANKLVKRLPVYGFMFDEFGRHAFQFVAVRRQKLLCFDIRESEQTSYFLINFAGGLFATVTLNLRLRTIQKRGLTLRATGQPNPLAHSVHRDHLTRESGRALKIVLRSGADLAKRNLF